MQGIYICVKSGEAPYEILKSQNYFPRVENCKKWWLKFRVCDFIFSRFDSNQRDRRIKYSCNIRNYSKYIRDVFHCVGGLVVPKLLDWLKLHFITAGRLFDDLMKEEQPESKTTYWDTVGWPEVDWDTIGWPEVDWDLASQPHCPHS